MDEIHARANKKTTFYQTRWKSCVVADFGIIFCKSSKIFVNASSIRMTLSWGRFCATCWRTRAKGAKGVFVQVGVREKAANCRWLGAGKRVIGEKQGSTWWAGSAIAKYHWLRRSPARACWRSRTYYDWRLSVPRVRTRIPFPQTIEHTVNHLVFQMSVKTE